MNVGARVPGSECGGPQPPFDSAVSVGREGVGSGEVADADEQALILGGAVRRDTAVTEVGDQCLGKHDGSVLLLVLFQQGGQGAADGQTGPVEGGYRGGLAVGVAGTDVGPPGLEGSTVRDRGDLTVGVLAGQPHLDVVGHLGGETHVTGGKQ